MKTIRKKIVSTMLFMLLVVSGILTGGFSTETVSGKAGDLTVHFLDVGQGLSILAQSEGQTLLYDGGDRSSASFVVSYLKKQNVEEIDYLISSHYDEDHVSGLVGCLNTFDVRNVIGADYVHDSGIYQSFIEGVKEQGLEIQHPEVGEIYSFGTGEFIVLSPDEPKENESNENSVAIKLVNGEDSFIFTGDAEYKNEADMVNSGIDLECDVLSVGHHGSASSSSWEFLQETVPEYAVISCGAGNQYGHPHKDTMDKFESMGIEIYRSDKQGTVLCTSDGSGLSWSEEPCNDYTPGDEQDKGTQPGTPEIKKEQGQSGVAAVGQMVWIPATGKKYHTIPDCGNMNPDKAEQVSAAMAKIMGYTACKKCN